MGFSYIYIAKLFCIDNDTRAARAIKRIPIFKYQLCVSRVSMTFYAREDCQNIGNRKNTVMQLNTSDVFKPLSKFRSFSFFYTHQASQRNIFIDISTNKNFKFSKVLFILLLSPIPKNPLI